MSGFESLQDHVTYVTYLAVIYLQKLDLLFKNVPDKIQNFVLGRVLTLVSGVDVAVRAELAALGSLGQPWQFGSNGGFWLESEFPPFWPKNVERRVDLRWSTLRDPGVWIFSYP